MVKTLKRAGKVTRSYERKGTPTISKPGTDAALAPIHEVVALRRLADDLFADLETLTNDNHRLVVENRALTLAVRQYKDSESILLDTITRMEKERNALAS